MDVTSLRRIDVSTTSCACWDFGHPLAPQYSKPCPPNTINPPSSFCPLLFQIQFEDVFAEPEGTHSFDPIWNASFSVFTRSKLWCYRILSSVCGVPCALFWGLHFACLGFAQIWIYTPSLRSFSIQVLPAARVFSMCVRWFVAPWYEACGKVFSGIRIQLSK